MVDNSIVAVFWYTKVALEEWLISSITFILLNVDQSCSPTSLINISHSVQWNIQQTEVAFPRFELRFEIDRVSETKKSLSIFYTPLVEFLSFKQENITPECWRKLSCANLKSYFILKLFFGYGHTKLEKNMMPPVKIRLIPCRSSTLAGRNRPCSKKFSHFFSNCQQGQVSLKEICPAQQKLERQNFKFCNAVLSVSQN